MNLKGKYQFIMVDSVPMLLLPAMALRLLSSIALSSRLVMRNSINLKGNKRNILIENESALNMEDVFMVKADNSCATKSGHFYLLLTTIFNYFLNLSKIISLF